MDAASSSQRLVRYGGCLLEHHLKIQKTYTRPARSGVRLSDPTLNRWYEYLEAQLRTRPNPEVCTEPLLRKSSETAIGQVSFSMKPMTWPRDTNDIIGMPDSRGSLLVVDFKPELALATTDFAVAKLVQNNVDAMVRWHAAHVKLCLISMVLELRT